MKLVFVPQFFYISIVMAIILSIYLYLERYKYEKQFDIKSDKVLIFVYLIMISVLIFNMSFRIWIFDMYFSPRLIITLFLLFILLIYFIYNKYDVRSSKLEPSKK